MLKDKLSSMRLLEGASVKEFIRQIQEIQAELRGLGDAIPDVELVERIVNAFSVRLCLCSSNNERGIVNDHLFLLIIGAGF